MNARIAAALVSGAAVAAVVSFMACARTASPAAAAADAGDAVCSPCVTSDTCGGGGVCAQVGGDTYCLLPCPNGDECGAGSTCAPIAAYNGAQENVCVSLTDICGTGQGAPSPVPDSGCNEILAPTSDAGSCGQCIEIGDGGLDASGVDASVYSTHCQANGCRHGLYCDLPTSTCEQPPLACGGHAVPFDGGDGVDGSVGADGGSVSRLYFAVVGDTRPANEDETSAYPTQIIDTIFGDIAALRPMPSFVVSTGDYMFASPTGTQQQPQVNLYLAARSKYPGVQFPAMGNHECTGATASNCGPNGLNGLTANYTTFLGSLLAPINQTSPYYSVSMSGSDGSWTAKFVFIAANAWDDPQSTWLDQTLAVPTTYTFVVRHEPADVSTVGTQPSETILAKYPYTLEIVGHTHTYAHLTAKEVLIGNGGAPLTGTGNYGFGVFDQQADGSITVDMIDYQTGLSDGSFHFAVNPDGSPAQ